MTLYDTTEFNIVRKVDGRLGLEHELWNKNIKTETPQKPVQLQIPWSQSKSLRKTKTGRQMGRQDIDHNNTV